MNRVAKSSHASRVKRWSAVGIGNYWPRVKSNRPYGFIPQVENGHIASLEKVVGLLIQHEIRVRLPARLNPSARWAIRCRSLAGSEL